MQSSSLIRRKRCIRRGGAVHQEGSEEDPANTSAQVCVWPRRTTTPSLTDSRKGRHIRGELEMWRRVPYAEDSVEQMRFAAIVIFKIGGGVGIELACEKARRAMQ